MTLLSQEPIRLTIVIANYNRPKIILGVLDSIFSQPLRDIELDVLVVDDASSLPIDPKNLGKYGDKLRVRGLEQNSGAHVARNVGIAEAKGDFILVSDDDDPLLDNSLQKAFDLIRELPNWQDYPMFSFARSNGHIPKPFMVVSEKEYFEHSLVGDFVPVINKKIFILNGFGYYEDEAVRRITAEHLLLWDIAYKFGIPTWQFCLARLGDEDTSKNRLTNASNWLIKAKQFARLQELEMAYMQENGFDLQYPGRFSAKLKGLFTYLLLDGRGMEARGVLHNRIKCHIWTRASFWVMSFLPSRVVFWLLRIYRMAK